MSSESAGVQVLELLPRFLRRDVLELLLVVLEPRGVRARQAAGPVAGRGLQRDRLVGADRLVLEEFCDRAGGNSFVREQVGGAHQYADAGTLGGQFGGGRVDDGRGPRVVHPACEQNLQPGSVSAQYVQLLIPQREARSRSDMPTALGTLEHEPLDSRIEELLQQDRGRHMHVRRDAARLKCLRLRGFPTRKQRTPRSRSQYCGQLLLPDLRIDEPEQAGSPGPITQRLGGLGEQLTGLYAAGRRHSHEREPAVLGNRRSKRRLVTDPRHRPLRNRQSTPQRATQ
jgi:hypothetical protein